MSEIDLQNKFPDMQPITNAPSLWTVNGIGFRLCGVRDLDEETGTHVKTYCFCLLFIPILAIRAYRVASAGAGWYFFGREPLSGLAKTYNMFLLAVAIGTGGIVGWESYTSTPEYVARTKRAEADRLAAAGEAAKAAQQYERLANQHVSQVPAATQGVKRLLDAPVGRLSPQDAVTVLRVASALVDRPGSSLAAPRIVERGIELAKSHAESDPAGALAVLDAIVLSAKDRPVLDSMRLPLLERLAAQRPDDFSIAARLAAGYLLRGDESKAEALLAPHSARLGTSEGARVLGEIYARQGKFEESYALLAPYTESRLARYHEAERNYTETRRQLGERVVRDLNKNAAPKSFYEQLNRLSHDQQAALVNEYVEAKIKEDPTLRQAETELIAAGAVVSVALELGIVTLQRARLMTDSAARLEAMERAEKSFVAIRGVAGVGETDEFRLYLGQVYYWLGKQDEGRKLFDELLAAHRRGADQLLAVAATMRELGDFSQARALAEEAHNAETDPRRKQNAAMLRALSPLDDDDHIAWLGRANQADPDVKASLSEALGKKAVKENRDQDAIKHFRDAANEYGKQSENPSTLNNGALARFSLFHVTGDRTEFQKGAAMLERAVTLKPSDSILMSNTASVVLQNGVMEIIGDSIDLKTLKVGANLELLSYLYDDEAAWKRYAEQVRSHAEITRARSYLEKALVLAPRKLELYAGIASIYGFHKNVDGMRGLLDRIQSAGIDLSDTFRRSKEFYSGETDAKLLKDLKSANERSEEIVRKVGEGSRGVTFAVAVGTVVRNRMSECRMGQDVDLDSLLQLAEEAHAAAPSAASRGSVIHVLLARASKTLAAAEPEYAQMVAKALRSFGQSHLIAFALARGGNLQQKISENPDVRRAISLIVEGARKFPTEHNAWEWAMLVATEPDEAARVAASLRDDPIEPIQNTLGHRLAPMAPAAALNIYWLRLINGGAADGLDLLRECAALGTPMPIDL